LASILNIYKKSSHYLIEFIIGTSAYILSKRKGRYIDFNYYTIDWNNIKVVTGFSHLKIDEK